MNAPLELRKRIQQGNLRYTMFWSYPGEIRFPVVDTNFSGHAGAGAEGAEFTVRCSLRFCKLQKANVVPFVRLLKSIDVSAPIFVWT